MYQIHTPSNVNSDPYSHEMFAARAVANYFHNDVTLIKRSDVAKSADLLVKNVIWEIKSPIGDSKRTMQNNLRTADDQSPNVIINLVRCKMRPDSAINRIRYELGKANKIKQLLVVHKNGKVIRLK